MHELRADHQHVRSWRPALSTNASSISLALQVSLIDHPWSIALAAAPHVVVESLPLSTINVGAVSLPIVAPKIKVASFPFPQVGSWRKSTRRRRALLPRLSPALLSKNRHLPRAPPRAPASSRRAM